MVAAACGPASAEGIVYHGTAPASSIVSTCSEKKESVELFLVVEKDGKGCISGEFYGKNTSPARLRQNESGRIDVIYPDTELNKTPAATLELIPSVSGYTFVLRDAVPDDPKLKDSGCWYTLLKAELAPLPEAPLVHSQKARDLFANQIAIATNFDLIFRDKEYRTAQENGVQILKEVERLTGRFSLESVNGLSILAFALLMQERYDEALEVIAPYRKALPDHVELKELEETLRELKKEQDELFRYDSDSSEEIYMEPLA
jgi:hypothetical protein